MNRYEQVLATLERIYEEELRSKLEGELIDFGTTTPDVDDGDAVHKVIRHWCDLIDDLLMDTEPFSDEWGALMERRGITFEEYQALFDPTIKPDDFDHYPVFAFFCILDETQRKQFIRGKTIDPKTYFQDLLTRDVGMLGYFLRQDLKAWFSIESLKAHCHVTGQSRSGKSQFLKLMMHRLQESSQAKRDKAIFLIEPAGDLAKQVLFFSHNKQYDRIIYIDPYIHELLGIQEQYVPIINPFELKDKNPKYVNILVEELASAFVQIAETGELSSQMKSLFKSCLSVLMMTDVPTIKDLYDFLGEDEKGKFYNLGLKHPDPVIRSFFKVDFFTPHYRTTRGSVRSRIYSVLMPPVFRMMTNGKSTIDLEEAMNRGKVVLINLAKGNLGPDTSQAYGRLILAQIQAIAQKRSSMPEHLRKSTFVFIDEAQNYLSETVDLILTESAKFGVHLILAHHHLKQIASPSVRETVSSNTSIKIVGVNASDFWESQAKQLNLSSAKDLEVLQKHHFYVKDKLSPKPAFIVKNPLTLLNIQDPQYYMPYSEKLEGDVIHRTLSEEQKDLLLWMIEKSGYYILAPSADTSFDADTGSPDDEDTPFVPKYDL